MVGGASFGVSDGDKLEPPGACLPPPPAQDDDDLATADGVLE